MAHSIDKVKDRQNEIKQNLETKKGELSELGEQKQSALEIGKEVQDSNMDDDAKRNVMDLINQELENISEKGKELSTEMGDDFSSLEDAKEEVSEMSEGTEQERRKLEQKKSFFEKFGLGKNIDSAISEMDDSQTRLDELRNSLLEDEKALTEVSHKLSSL